MTRFTSMRKKAEQQSNRFALACRLCQGMHPIRLCPSFRGKTTEERLREALIGRFCGNCLSMMHRSDKCTSEERCREKHHTTLHMDDESEPLQPIDTRPWSEQVASEDESERALSINASDHADETRPLRLEDEPAESTPESGTPLPTITRGSETRPFRPLLAHERRRERGSETRPFRPRSTARLNRRAETRPFRLRQKREESTWPNRDQGRLETRPRQLSIAFRAGRLARETQALRPVTSIAPTVVVKIEARGRLHLIRALIDVCSPTSIIATDLAVKLRLDVSNFGTQRGCLLRLRGKHGQNTRLAIHATTINNYVRVSPTSCVDPSVATAYTHIRLADPNFYTSTPIRLVLGADVYPDIVLPGMLPNTFGPFIAQSTIFGWMLDGVCRS
ncbi:uncharacterized protein LOC118755686 [Rhagoletis pomonella]|uniref:uncharacterized protein LOC118755686 n=1 Tax=Rhagoletis pomonella TaxID=28610 RepID=UPI001780ED92|nr:uncharacterized protein LOC118755686 [Rhagoletis pomonella]